MADPPKEKNEKSVVAAPDKVPEEVKQRKRSKAMKAWDVWHTGGCMMEDCEAEWRGHAIEKGKAKPGGPRLCVNCYGIWAAETSTTPRVLYKCPTSHRATFSLQCDECERTGIKTKHGLWLY